MECPRLIHSFGVVQPDGYNGCNEEYANDIVRTMRQIKQLGKWKKDILQAIKYFFSKTYYEEFEALDMRTGEMTNLPRHEDIRTFGT